MSVPFVWFVDGRRTMWKLAVAGLGESTCSPLRERFHCSGEFFHIRNTLTTVWAGATHYYGARYSSG